MISLPKLLTESLLARRTLMWSAHIGVFALSGLAAFLLRFDLNLPPDYRYRLEWALIIWISVKIIVFAVAKLDRGVWRYVSLADLIRVAGGNLAASIISCILILCLAPPGFPRSIYVLDLMICFLATGGMRAAVRVVLDRSSLTRRRGTAKRTLIYGTGAAGVALLHEIYHNSKLAYDVRGFLDDGKQMQGMRLTGVSVLGGGDDLIRLVKKQGIEVILVAIPSATGTEMTRILELCHAAGVECKTVPCIADLIEGQGIAGQIREVAVEDLLDRAPIRLEESAIRKTIEDKVVLVTGAAGSIGSELCRQIAAFGPAAIVGYDVAETPLFEIDREMRDKFPAVPFYPEIGNASKSRALRRCALPISAACGVSCRGLQARSLDGRACF